MKATPLISSTLASAVVFLLMKLAVMAMASFPRNSFRRNPAKGDRMRNQGETVRQDRETRAHGSFTETTNPKIAYDALKKHNQMFCVMTTKQVLQFLGAEGRPGWGWGGPAAFPSLMERSPLQRGVAGSRCSVRWFPLSSAHTGTHTASSTLPIPFTLPGLLAWKRVSPPICSDDDVKLQLVDRVCPGVDLGSPADSCKTFGRCNWSDMCEASQLSQLRAWPSPTRVLAALSSAFPLTLTYFRRLDLLGVRRDP